LFNIEYSECQNVWFLGPEPFPLTESVVNHVYLSHRHKHSSSSWNGFSAGKWAGQVGLWNPTLLHRDKLNLSHQR